MSEALQSLMHDVPRAPERAGQGHADLLAFVMIGGGGALAFVVLSSLLVLAGTGLAHWLVNALCYGALIGPVYLLHRRFSFASHAPHHQALPRYLAVQAMALVLAAVFSFVVHGVLAVPTVFASMLVIALTSGINFAVLRSWAFARTRLRAVAAVA